jgi:hypothetical protein
MNFRQFVVATVSRPAARPTILCGAARWRCASDLFRIPPSPQTTSSQLQPSCASSKRVVFSGGTLDHVFAPNQSQPAAWWVLIRFAQFARRTPHSTLGAPPSPRTTLSQLQPPHARSKRRVFCSRGGPCPSSPQLVSSGPRSHASSLPALCGICEVWGLRQTSRFWYDYPAKPSRRTKTLDWLRLGPVQNPKCKLQNVLRAMPAPCPCGDVNVSALPDP